MFLVVKTHHDLLKPLPVIQNYRLEAFPFPTFDSAIIWSVRGNNNERQSVTPPREEQRCRRGAALPRPRDPIKWMLWCQLLEEPNYVSYIRNKGTKVELSFWFEDVCTWWGCLRSHPSGKILSTCLLSGSRNKQLVSVSTAETQRCHVCLLPNTRLNKWLLMTTGCWFAF